METPADKDVCIPVDCKAIEDEWKSGARVDDALNGVVEIVDSSVVISKNEGVYGSSVVSSALLRVWAADVISVVLIVEISSVDIFEFEVIEGVKFFVFSKISEMSSVVAVVVA